jgi:hypothetical protein
LIAVCFDFTEKKNGNTDNWYQPKDNRKKINTAKKNRIQIIDADAEKPVNCLKTRYLLLMLLMIWLKKSGIQIIDSF